ncbi:hypothetical protein AHiyo8_27830 [Arthrobacter sp. Hiyo8]|nr:hypothetical protein AHiyo8_27830 [Arthrobacter sp. Hiyo8]GAP59139.1 hypothetical protein AHiyo1_23680 [Arthrobacter sp. Hiyo1]
MRLLAFERERQAGNREGQEKDRQGALPATPESGGFALGGVEGPVGKPSVASRPPSFIWAGPVDRYCFSGASWICFASA